MRTWTLTLPDEGAPFDEWEDALDRATETIGEVLLALPTSEREAMLATLAAVYLRTEAGAGP